MVAGVAMGLILEGDGRFVVLTDILGSGARRAAARC
jgi:polyribonucleotide nucleotidyltransferase